MGKIFLHELTYFSIVELIHTTYLELVSHHQSAALEVEVPRGHALQEWKINFHIALHSSFFILIQIKKNYLPFNY